MLYLVVSCHAAVQQVKEMGLCLLMERMHRIGFQSLPAFKHRIQGVIHAVESPAYLQFQQAGDFAHQRLQNGCNQLHSLLFIHALFQGVQHNMLNHKILL